MRRVCSTNLTEQTSDIVIPSGEESHVQVRPMTFLMLPNDLIFNCLSRVSRLYYPILSLVSKRLSSLIASPELYETRSSLGRTENCLYVSLSVCSTSDMYGLHWFTLCQRPNSSKKILVPISSHNSLFAYRSGVTMVGSSLYAIGGLLNNNALSSVMVMDCSSTHHTYREAPSMRVPRVSPSVCVVDRKIYVTGGLKNSDSTNWIEVFDTKTETWEFLNIPSEEICIYSNYETFGYEGTIYVRSVEKYGTYKLLHKGKWRESDLALKSGWWTSSYCVIDNVLYRFDSGKINWYDSYSKFWKDLKGLPRSSIPRFENCYDVGRLADYGGNMVVLWQETISRYTKIWCAEIELARNQQGDICGTVKWFEDVCSTKEPNGNLVHAFATTL